MGIDFTDFNAGCHGPVPLGSAICFEERLLRIR